ncbi:MAG: hypothetical protein P1P65_04870 [Treponema sp.]
MMKKRIPLMLFLCTVLSTAVSARTIGFTCMCNSDAPSYAFEVITALETELFELSFDYGLIATSVEHTMNGLDQYNSNPLLVKLFDSSLDYLVAVYCEYGQAPVQKPDNADKGLKWKEMHWKIIDFSSRTVIFEGTVEPDSVPEPDILQKAKNIGKMIGYQVLKNL